MGGGQGAGARVRVGGGQGAGARVRVGGGQGAGARVRVGGVQLGIAGVLNCCNHVSALQTFIHSFFPHSLPLLATISPPYLPRPLPPLSLSFSPLSHSLSHSPFPFNLFIYLNIRYIRYKYIFYIFI